MWPLVFALSSVAMLFLAIRGMANGLPVYVWLPVLLLGLISIAYSYELGNEYGWLTWDWGARP